MQVQLLLIAKHSQSKNQNCVLPDLLPETLLWCVILNRFSLEVKLPAGDQFWNSGHQHSIFSHIGDQLVAISGPDYYANFCPLVLQTQIRTLYCIWDS